MQDPVFEFPRTPTLPGSGVNKGKKKGRLKEPALIDGQCSNISSKHCPLHTPLGCHNNLGDSRCTASHTVVPLDSKDSSNRLRRCGTPYPSCTSDRYNRGTHNSSCPKPT